MGLALIAVPFLRRNGNTFQYFRKPNMPGKAVKASSAAHGGNTNDEAKGNGGEI